MGVTEGMKGREMREEGDMCKGKVLISSFTVRVTSAAVIDL